MLDELADLSSTLKQRIASLSEQQGRAEAAALDAAELLKQQKATTAEAAEAAAGAAGRLQAREARLNRMVADLRYKGVVSGGGWCRVEVG